MKAVVKEGPKHPDILLPRDYNKYEVVGGPSQPACHCDVLDIHLFI